MSLVPSLLQAIVRVDGEALVMHAGDKPYVVSPTGQVELASRGLTLEAVNGIVSPAAADPRLQNALDEFGAVQYELAAVPEFPGEHFTVVAARGGDDVWVEIRRRRIPEDDRVPDEFFGPAHVPPPQPIVAETTAAAPPTPVVYDNDELPVEMLGFDTATVVERAPGVLEAMATPPVTEVAPVDEDLTLPDESHLWPGQTAAAAAHLASARQRSARGSRRSRSESTSTWTKTQRRRLRKRRAKKRRESPPNKKRRELPPNKKQLAKRREWLRHRKRRASPHRLRSTKRSGLRRKKPRAWQPKKLLAKPHGSQRKKKLRAWQPRKRLAKPHGSQRKKKLRAWQPRKRLAKPRGLRRRKRQPEWQLRKKRHGSPPKKKPHDWRPRLRSAKRSGSRRRKPHVWRLKKPRGKPHG